MPRTVLLVDDDPLARRTLRVVLTDAGFAVVDEATDGMHAIALAAVHEPDLVVLDQMMPILGGHDAISAILSVSPRSQVILHTAVDSELLPGEAIAAGAAAVVSKLESFETLVAAMHRTGPA